jgi:hypothetical protein
MKNWFSKNYKTIIILAFLIPIITVALVSISHVTKWYGISNPVTWSIYLSVGIEIAALSALAAISANMGKKVYFPFGIVTLIQFIGNIYFAYSYIDINSQSFTSWVELVSPLVEFMGVDPNDYIGHKRFLAFFAGGMLPIISLSFLHMLVKFTQEDKKVTSQEPEKKTTEEKIEGEIPVVDAKDVVGEVSRIRLSENDLETLEKILNNPPNPNEALKNAADHYKDVLYSQKDKETSIEPTEIVEEQPQVIEEIPEPIVEEQPVVIEEQPQVIEEIPEPIVEEQPVVEEVPVVEEPATEETIVVEETLVAEEEPVIVTDGLLDVPLPIFEEQPVVIEEQPVVIEELNQPGESLEELENEFFGKLDVEIVPSELIEEPTPIEIEDNGEIITENDDDEKKK